MNRNIPLFIAFRVFFNARFYYPVLGVLFLDLGLTLEQYALLNTVLTLVGALIFSGLAGLCLATPIWGLWVILPIGLSMPMMQYFLSNYLNAWTDSKLRATVLSFRGVAINLGYGLAGIGFASVTAGIRSSQPGLSENTLFARSLSSLPIAFLLGAAALLVFVMIFPPKK